MKHVPYVILKIRMRKVKVNLIGLKSINVKRVIKKKEKKNADWA